MAAKLVFSSSILKLTAPSSSQFHPSRCYARVCSATRRILNLEYAQLNLTDKISEELGPVRVRQHVNPLRSTFSVPVEVPNWNDVFRDPTLPLMVDIGSGSGRFLMWLANNNQDSSNYLGIEIREKLVKRAEYWIKELALANIHFLFANATISFQELVLSYPGPLMLVSILCPDPHFKKRHHKRRVVQKPLVDSIINNLVPGGKIFVQSDVVEVAVDMRNQFDSESHLLQHIDEIDPSMLCENDGWLLNNPMGIRTEREIYAESEGGKIYRRLYQKRT
ncbi:tRNA (guanine-N-7) methyltransferase [Euphorbia peplus]|nr:tRNA (guanine-N-7) methyltransferase [Euphorbia peplus]